MTTDQKFIVTVILHHDQSKTLEQTMIHLRKTSFYRDFRPKKRIGTNVLGGCYVLRVHHLLAVGALWPAQSEQIHGRKGLGSKTCV